jgi:hypothetical protein
MKTEAESGHGSASDRSITGLKIETRLIGSAEITGVAQPCAPIVTSVAAISTATTGGDHEDACNAT